MKRAYPLIIALVLVLALVGTSEAKKKHKAPPADPGYPGKAATHTVTLQKVLLSDMDFTRDSTGNTLPVSVEITEDGALITPTSGDTVLKGTRGEMLLQTPVQWVINYDPHKNYQIIVTEVVPAGSTGKRIVVPATPTQGYWPIGKMAGKVILGQQSYLLFVDKT